MVSPAGEGPVGRREGPGEVRLDARFVGSNLVPDPLTSRVANLLCLS
jgi:hypothetical protein